MTNLGTQAVVPSLPSYRFIPLTRGKFAIVDEADFDWLNQWQWSLSTRGYAERRVHGHVISMHNEILRTPRHRRGDHWNGDTLDNRRCNLRIATRKVNAQNASISRNNTSGVTGVSWQKSLGKWFVFITVNQRRKNLGYYESLEQAVSVRKAAEIRYYGEIIRSACPERIIIGEIASPIQRASRSNSESGLTGITFHEKTGKWMARVYRNKTTHYLGLFSPIEAAIAARDLFIASQTQSTPGS